LVEAIATRISEDGHVSVHSLQEIHTAKSEPATGVAV
jgi:hypothetical protein